MRDAEGIASVRRAVVAKYGLPARFSDLTDSLGSKVGLKRKPRAGFPVAVEPVGSSRPAGDGPNGRRAGPTGSGFGGLSRRVTRAPPPPR